MGVINKKDWETVEGILVRKGIITTTAFSDSIQDGLAALEERSWWFKYRATVVEFIINRYMNKGDMIWDVGAGNGYTTLFIQNKGYCVATLEPSFEACRNAQKRGIMNIHCGTLDREGIIDGSMESIMVLDVIEHIEDDSGFLKLMYDKLSSGARALITVPAFMSLWSSNDVDACHFRRYTIPQLRELCVKSGFTVVYENYFMRFCFIPVYIIRVLFVKMGLLHREGYRTQKEADSMRKLEFGEKMGLVGRFLQSIENKELKRIKAGKKIPYGSSLIMVVKKA